MKILILVIVVLFNLLLIKGQCVISSSDGYSVEVYVNPISVVAPSSCPWGYNYNIVVKYDVLYTGTPPSGLYTLQGVLKCGSQSLFFDLPNTSGSGTATTVSNPYNNNTDCNAATVQSLGCQNSSIEISGPGISHRVISCLPASLPVELNYFEAQYSGDDIKLVWETEAELNNDKFTVESSVDASRWSVVGEVRGVGNSSTPISYSLIDESPSNGIIYYRLKQTDFDGEYSYSKIVAIELKNTSTILVYPNPSSGIIIIQDTGEVITSEYKIFDLLGKEMTNLTRVTGKSTDELVIDISLLNSGSYFVVKSNSVIKFNRL